MVNLARAVKELRQERKHPQQRLQNLNQAIQVLGQPGEALKSEGTRRPTTRLSAAARKRTAET